MLRTIPALALLWTSSCLSSAPPVALRYFQLPERLVSHDVDASFPSVRIAGVEAVPAIRESLAWRLSPVELAYDETASWVAAPTTLVADRLARRLFEQARFTQDGEQTTAVRVRIVAFEGVLDGTSAARVALLVELEARGEPTVRRRFESQVALAEKTSVALAHGLGEALDGALDDLVEWLLQA